MTDEPFINFKFTATGGANPQGLRTDPDRLADIINVKDWGAKGDGSTNDEAAIQAAITACIGPRTVNLPGPNVPSLTTTVRGGTVFFPPGKYICATTGNLSVGSGTSTTRVNLLGCGQNGTQVTANISKGSGTFDNIGRVDGFNLNSLTLTGTSQTVTDCLGPIDASGATNASLWTCSVNSGLNEAANVPPGPTPGSIGYSLGNSCCAYNCRVQAFDIAWALSGTGCGLFGCSAETNRTGIRVGWSPNGGGPGVAGALTAQGFTINAFECERNDYTLDLYDCNGGLVTGMVCQGQIAAMNPSQIDNITWGSGTAHVTTHIPHNLPSGQQMLQLDYDGNPGAGAGAYLPNYGNQLQAICTRTGASTFDYDLPNNPGQFTGTVTAMSWNAGTHVVTVTTGARSVAYQNGLQLSLSGMNASWGASSVNITGISTTQFSYPGPTSAPSGAQTGNWTVSPFGWMYPQYYNVRLRHVHNVALIANNWAVNAAFATFDFEYVPTTFGFAPPRSGTGEAQHSNNMLWDCNVLYGVQLPTTNPANLAGWNFRGVYGVVNSFEGHAGWTGVNTVAQPEAHMKFADLPGHGAPFELGPYEGQEYNITDSPTPASGNFNANVTTGGSINHVKLRYDASGTPNWKISG